MLKDFKDIIHDMILDRTEDIGSNLLINDLRYIEQSERRSEIIKKIKDLLSDEHKHLIYDLDCVSNRIAAIVEEIMYEQGLKDGMEIKKGTGRLI